MDEIQNRFQELSLTCKAQGLQKQAKGKLSELLKK